MTIGASFALWASFLIICLYTPLQMGVATILRIRAERRHKILLGAHYLAIALVTIWIIGLVTISLLWVDNRLRVLNGLLSLERPALLVNSFFVGIVLFKASPRFIDILISLAALRPRVTLNLTAQRFPEDAQRRSVVGLIRLYSQPSFLVITFLTNLLEEFLFRGILMVSIWQMSGSAWLGVIIAAAVYGSYHYGITSRDGLIHGLNGLVYGLCFIIGGYWSAVTAHLAFNFLTLHQIRSAYTFIANPATEGGPSQTQSSTRLSSHQLD